MVARFPAGRIPSRERIPHAAVERFARVWRKWRSKAPAFHANGVEGALESGLKLLRRPEPSIQEPPSEFSTKATDSCSRRIRLSVELT